MSLDAYKLPSLKDKHREEAEKLEKEKKVEKKEVKEVTKGRRLNK